MIAGKEQEQEQCAQKLVQLLESGEIEPILSRAVGLCYERRNASGIFSGPVYHFWEDTAIMLNITRERLAETKASRNPNAHAKKA